MQPIKKHKEQQKLIFLLYEQYEVRLSTVCSHPSVSVTMLERKSVLCSLNLLMASSFEDTSTHVFWAHGMGSLAKWSQCISAGWLVVI